MWRGVDAGVASQEPVLVFAPLGKKGKNSRSVTESHVWGHAAHATATAPRKAVRCVAQALADGRDVFYALSHEGSGKVDYVGTVARIEQISAAESAATWPHPSSGHSKSKSNRGGSRLFTHKVHFSAVAACSVDKKDFLFDVLNAQRWQGVTQFCGGKRHRNTSLAGACGLAYSLQRDRLPAVRVLEGDMTEVLDALGVPAQ